MVLLVKIIGARLLQHVAGIIAITDELRRVEIQKARPNTPLSIAITNGIDVESVPFTGFKRYNDSELHLVFVASHFQPWIGCDRLLSGLTRHNGEPIVLHLVGNADKELRMMANTVGNGNRVLLHGTLAGEKLERVLAHATLAVGSLALHRNRMHQGSTLKVREYTARGIPFFYAYEDPDIPDDALWALRLEGNERPVEIRRIIDFARQVSRVDELSSQMRNYASEHLEWRVKTRQMYEFALRACQHG